MTDTTIDSLQKVISASKKREISLKENIIYLQSDNTLYKNKISTLEHELSQTNLKYKQKFSDFNIERDELNFTIKLLKKQCEDNRKELSLYSNLKRQSDRKYVDSLGKQKEFNRELGRCKDENRKLKDEVERLKRKSGIITSKIEDHAYRDGSLENLALAIPLSASNDNFDLQMVQTHLSEQQTIINSLLDQNKKFQESQKLIHELTDHNKKLNLLNKSLIEEIKENKENLKNIKITCSNLRDTNKQLLISLKRSQEQEKRAYEKFRRERGRVRDESFRYLSEKDIFEAMDGSGVL